METPIKKTFINVAKFWQLIAFFVMLWIFIGYTTELLVALQASLPHSELKHLFPN